MGQKGLKQKEFRQNPPLPRTPQILYAQGLFSLQTTGKKPNTKSFEVGEGLGGPKILYAEVLRVHFLYAEVLRVHFFCT